MSPPFTAAIALVLLAVFGALGFGWRAWLQRRRTGPFGFDGVSGRIGSVEWIAGLLSVLAALELQVRRIEEPYLLAKHGAHYRDYTARVGRFIPGIGLIH